MSRQLACLNPSTVWKVPEVFSSIYSHAVEAAPGARTLFISGQVGVAPDGQVPSDFCEQTALAMSNVENLLAPSRMTLSNLVKLNFYMTRAEDAPNLAALRQERWGTQEPPAVTAIVVSALARPEFLIEIEAIAADW